MERTPVDNIDRERAVAEKMLAHTAKCFAAQKLPFEEGKHWQMGKTMVFLKPEVSQSMMLMMHQAMEDFVPSVALFESLWQRKLLKEELGWRQSGMVRAQAHMRKVLVMRGHSVSAVCGPPMLRPQATVAAHYA